MPVVLNGANEVAVAAFLERRIGFREIHRIIDEDNAQHANRRAQRSRRDPGSRSVGARDKRRR